MHPPIHYARSGDLKIAYQVTGDGPIDLIWTPGTVSQLDMEWDWPPRARVLEGFGAFCRLIRFDKRGTGLSDRPNHIATLEERTDDIRAVMDAARSTRAVIFGVSEGSSMACLFAATYPERTRALVIWGGQARWLKTEKYPWGVTPERLERDLAEIDENGVTNEYVFPHGTPDDPAYADWLIRWFRAGASPAALVALERMNSEIDIIDILPHIRVPDRVLAAIEEFITGAPAHLRTNRVLASIMVLDMVESTKHAAALGDEAWRDLLFRHRATTDGLVAYYGGMVVDHAGDGVLATFDGPARSIRCAIDSIDKAHELGLQLRGGIHTGEVEREGNAAAGIAVHMAARISAFAEADEVLVSSTVRDLVAGSGIEFEDRGAHHFKGIDEARRVYRVAGV